MNRFFKLNLVLFFLILYSSVIAHPAEDIILKYDSKNRVLSIGVMHDTLTPQHYVNKINIKINGKLWITQNFSAQISSEAQAAGYAAVDLNKGDVVEVSVTCSKTGKLSKTFTI